MTEQTESTATIGQRGFYVSLFGDEDDEVGVYTRPGGVWGTKAAAKRQAERMLRAAKAEKPSVFWNAAIDKGQWEAHGDNTFQFMDFEVDHSYSARTTWLQVVDGELVDVS